MNDIWNLKAVFLSFEFDLKIGFGTQPCQPVRKMFSCF